MTVHMNGLKPEVRQRAEAMVRDSGGRLWISSAFRTYDEQARTYAAAAIAHPSNPRAWAAFPGTSNHERGLAIDVSPDRYAEARLRLFHAYGFRQTLANENWHAELDPNRRPMPGPPTPPPAPPPEDTVPFLPPIPCPTGGYWEVETSTGAVFAFDGAPFYKGLADLNVKPNQPVVSLTPFIRGGDLAGYWLAGRDGAVFAFGEAPYLRAPTEFPSWSSPGAYFVGLIQTGGQVGGQRVSYALLRKDPLLKPHEFSRYEFPLAT